MDALKFKTYPEVKNKFKKAVVVDTDICIACGVCAYKCPTKTLTLEPLERITRPPKTFMDYAMSRMNDLIAGREKSKNTKNP